jgi:hypothetical protein
MGTLGQHGPHPSVVASESELDAGLLSDAEIGIGLEEAVLRQIKLPGLQNRVI